MKTTFMAVAACIAVLAAHGADDPNQLYAQGVEHFGAQKYELAVAAWQQAAATGHAPATYRLALMLRDGRGVDADTGQALALATAAAEKGYTPAQRLLSSFYDLGFGVDADAAQAMTWLLKAALAGDPDAQLESGYRFASGLGVEQDYEAASRWYRLAAGHGVADAFYELGNLYLGSGLEEDPYAAARWFRTGALLGQADAQYALGRMLEVGVGCVEDKVEAATWYWRSLAGDMHDAESAIRRLMAQLSEEEWKAAQQRAAELGAPSWEALASVIDVHRVNCQPAEVVPGQKFDIGACFTVLDSHVFKEYIDVGFAYAISRGEDLVFQAAPIKLRIKNGQPIIRIEHDITATTEPGLYQLAVAIVYEGVTGFGQVALDVKKPEEDAE